MTSNPRLFAQLAEKGRKLVNLHTMRESPPADAFPYSGDYQDIIVSPGWKNNTLLIGKASAIAGVERGVWEFRMGGYDVCKSWFSAGRKARIQREGEDLSRSFVLELRTIFWSIRETLRIRAEIDNVLDGFGGWPIT